MTVDPRSISSYLVQRFADAWRSDPGQPPDVIALFQQHPDATPAVQAEVLRIELENRARHHQPARLEDYLSACPDLSNQSDLLLELIALEQGLRGEDVDAPTATELTHRFPELAGVPDLARTIRQHFVLSGGASEALRPGDAAPAGEQDESTHGTKAWDVSTQTFSQKRSVPQAKPGSLFGDYELLEEIARGGMGVVYKAKQRKLNRVVALKMILSGQLASSEEVRRFYSEAAAAAKLDHPGIVPIHEVNELEGQHFFSMGLVDGCSLSEQLRDGPLPTRRAAELMVCVAEAVEYAHQRGIVHRDLKPGNILLARDGQPKVTDFGLAKTVESDSGLTATGQVLGTPSYMPPEQAAGRIEEIGPVSDVYSLGAVLYCLLTGRPPFQSANVVETIRQVLEREPASPRTLNPAIDRDLQTICLKCLEKNPEDRFASAREFAEELQRYLRGEPIRSRPIGPVTRSWRWCKRKPVVAGFGLAIVLAIVTSAAAWFSMQTVRQVRKLANLRTAFETQIDDPQLTETYLVEMENLLSQIARDLPEEAREREQRLYERFQQAVEARIRQPRLDAKTAEQIAAAISLIEQRGMVAANRVVQLRNALQRRLSDWKQIVDLRPPYGDLESVFQTTDIESQAEQLRLARPPSADRDSEMVPFQPLLLSSGSASQFRVQLAPSWQDGAKVGLVLNGTAQRSYSFVLRMPTGARVGRGAADGAAESAITFATGRARSQSAVAEIRKNGVVQQRQQIPIVELPDGPLTLHAQRDRDQLSFQIHHRDPLRFQDIFPLGTDVDGRFGIIWPKETGIQSLSILERNQPPDPSDLQRGDSLFDQQRYGEALPLYSNIALTANTEAFRQEAAYKQAICLVELNRPEEAGRLLQALFTEEGEQWPLLAGCQLWLLHIRAGHSQEAESMYQSLAARFQFEQLASLLPRAIRDEIVDSYLAESSNVSRLLMFNPQRLQNLERAAAIDRLLSPDGEGERWVQIDLARAYRFAGNLQPALEITAKQAERYPHPTLFRLHSRLLRLTGQPQLALDELQQAIDHWDWDFHRLPWDLMLERGRVYVALERWREAESDIDFLLLHGQNNNPRSLTYAYLIKGFLRARMGDQRGAQQAWRKGYQFARPVVAQTETATSELINVLILGSLCDELSQDIASPLMSILLGGGGNNSLIRMTQSMIGPDKLTLALRQMWQTPFGRQLAEDFAFERFTLAERVRIPLQLAVLEFIRQNAFSGEMSAEQQDMVWQLARDAFNGFVIRGDIGSPQMVQLGLAWKGTTNVLGWSGVAPALDRSLRARMAYVFAYRYIHRNESDKAKSFLQTAIADGEGLANLQRMARDAVEQLSRKSGTLVLESAAGGPSSVLLSQDGQEPRRVLVKERIEVELPAGQYTLKLEEDSPLLTLPVERLRMNVMQRRVVKIQQEWAATNWGESLPGRLSRPATLDNGRRWQILQKHASRNISSLAWSPDDKRIAVGDETGTVRVYELPSGDLVQVLLGHEHQITAMDFSPDGQFLLSGSSGGTIRLWQPESGKQLRMLTDHRYHITSIRWRPDGSQIASADGEGKILLWELTRPTAIVLDGHPGGIAQLAWHPTNSQVATIGTRDGAVKIWDVEQAEAILSLGPLQESLQQVCWRPDGEQLAVGSQKKIRLFSVSPSEQLSTLTTQHLRGVQWNATGRQLFVADNQDVYAYDDSDLAAEPKRLTGLQNAHAVRWNDDRTAIAVSSWDAQVKVYPQSETQTEPPNTPRTSIGVPLSNRWSADWNADGTILAVSGDRGTMILLDRQNRSLRKISAGEARLSQVRWSGDGQQLAAASDDGKIYRWSSDGEPKSYLEGHTAAVTDLAWSPDNSKLVSASRDRTIRIWNAAGEEESQTTVGEGQVFSIAWSDNGRIAVGDETREIHLFDASLNRRRQFKSQDGNHPPLALDFSPDQQRLLVGSRWSAGPLYELSGKPGPPFDAAGSFHTVDWGPDGSVFVGGGSGGSAAVWNVEGQRIRQLLGHRHDLNAVSWSPKRDRIATIGQNQTVRIWDAATGKELEMWLLLPDEEYLLATPSGRILAQSPMVSQYVTCIVEQVEGGFKVEPLEAVTSLQPPP